MIASLLSAIISYKFHYVVSQCSGPNDVSLHTLRFREIAVTNFQGVSWLAIQSWTLAGNFMMTGNLYGITVAMQSVGSLRWGSFQVLFYGTNDNTQRVSEDGQNSRRSFLKTFLHDPITGSSKILQSKTLRASCCHGVDPTYAACDSLHHRQFRGISLITT